MDAGRVAQTNEVAEVAQDVARRSYGKLIAFLAARTRDVAGAEDALSEAFASALTDWPVQGIPLNPQAWLLTVARRRMIDAGRRRQTSDAATDHLVLLDTLAAGATTPGAIPDATTDAIGAGPDIPDDRLALMFVCAHPAIDRNVRSPLMLQTTLGLDAATIASAFLVAPATMSQRLVRAKQKIRQARIPFRVPEPEDLPGRMDAVLEAIYAAFAEGWSDPAGTEARPRNLTEEGIWLGRLMVSLMPDEPEALGLLALMLHAHARRHARRDAAGDYVPLSEQDPARWEAPLIDEAEAALLRASAKGRAGRYQIEAAIQSAHVVRRQTGRADWSAIEKLYDILFAMTESPVVAINRAVAIAENRGPQAGLAALAALHDDTRLQDYQPYWAARAQLLAQSGASKAADESFGRAIGLERDERVRQFLQKRRAMLGQ